MQLLLYHGAASLQLLLPGAVLRQKEVILPRAPLFQSPRKSSPLPGV